MNKSLSNTLTLMLAIVGFFVALVLVFGKHVSSSATGCFRTGEGCASAANSVYGHVGPVPTSVVGLLMYVAFIALCVLRSKRLTLARDREAARAAAYASSAAIGVEDVALNEEERQTIHTPEVVENRDVVPGSIAVRPLDALVWGTALLGFGISFWLQYISIYQLHSFCKFCFGSAAIVTLIFALASRDYLLDGRKLTGEQKMIGGVLTLIVVLGGFMVFPDVWNAITHPDPPQTGPLPVSDARAALTASLLHTKGDSKAKYLLVEFADYQCSHCSEAIPEVEKLLKLHSKDIRFAFRNNPFPNHQWAREAAFAAEAAGEQGKFWEMHDLLFKHTKDMESPLFNSAEFNNFARALHLDVARFEKDRSSSAMESRVRTDIEAATAGRLQSTPTFFLITPTHVTNIPGTIELGKILNNPQAKEWQ